MPENDADLRRSDPETVPEHPDEAGAWKHPEGWTRYVAPSIAIAWSLFQLVIASNLSITIGERRIPLGLTLDSTYVRCIHLAFAMALVFLTRPAFKKARLGWRHPARRDRIGWFDGVLAIVGAGAALYLMIDYEGIATRMGMPIGRDVVFGLILFVLLLEACRRAIGPALPAIALVFCAYAFLGPHMPGVLAFKGVSLNRFVGQMTMSLEGIYGTPLYVSARIVFLFVLFGAMLERAGGGKYFTQLAISLLGGFRGGPAKAAVLSSGFTGMVSGSSIANIVTTGTFTIPLMKKAGYPATKAAAIEVAASTDGQLAPPIMGAAAFIIAEYVPGADYIDVVKAAAIPAFASYAALLYITHLEACKLGLKRIPRAELPPFWGTFIRGLHFLLPVLFLIHQLIFLRRTPETAAFHACWVMALIMVGQHGVRAAVRREAVWPQLRRGAHDLLSALSAGARNMIAVALATAGAGIIVGVVSMGLSGLITEIIARISMGNIYLLLIFTALTSLIIGMGLPTTATYITMATLTAPIIVQVGSTYGLVVPLMAAHLFVFYFGILADDTPPVGLAAYTASAIAKSPPIATGIQGFLYDIRTAILPFMFVFNVDLILHGIDSWGQGLLVFAMACAANFAFAAATQGWFIRRNRWWEAALLLGVTFALFRVDLVARWLGMPHELRYWAWLPGVALFGLIFAIQKVRRETA